MQSNTFSLFVPPVVSTAILLLATGHTWRNRRAWVERLGLAAGVLMLSLAFCRLPAVVFCAALPTASILISWVVFAGSEWRFAPDFGQSGWIWAIHAAVRSTLGTAFGAAAGFGPVIFLPESPLLPLLCATGVLAGLLCAHAFDQACVGAADTPGQFPPADDDGGQLYLEPERIIS